MSAPQPDVDGYAVESSEVVWDGILSTARIDAVRMPDGSVADREVVAHVSAAAVVALTDDDEVVLLRQYRHAVRRRTLELPAGVLDVDGEDPGDAAVRELAEEAAWVVDVVAHLVSFDNSAGWTDERTHVYVGRGARPGSRPEGFDPVEEEADLEVVVLDRAEAVAMVRRGEITDAKTVVGLLAVA